jgi:ribosomal protein L35
MKTNKSFLKRLKITKNGKIMARKPGQDHFNAKESRNHQLSKKRQSAFPMTQRAKRRFLA